MKKMIVILALAVVSFANAQKGTVLVAGSVGYYSSKNLSYPDNSNFQFSPKIGYQYSDNMTVGIESSIGSSKYTYNSYSQYDPSPYSVDVKNKTFNIGGFLRYSKSLGGAFSAYADLSAGILSQKQSVSVPSSMENKSNGFYAGITPAVFIDLKKSFGLNFSIGGLGYRSMKQDTPNAKRGTFFNFDFGQNINIGISKNF